MLTVSELHAHYGLSHVIQGIDLEARPGEVVGIFGRNGVGKTTLLKTIVGWVKPSSGDIRLDGERLDGREPDAICHMGVGFVPEDRRIFPGLTVQENLELGLLQVKGRPARESRAALERVYDRFPRLSERRKQLGTTLSGGEQQMLAIARVMVGQPKLVLVDEPSEGLGADDRRRHLRRPARFARERRHRAAGRAKRARGALACRPLLCRRARTHRARRCGG